MIYAYKYGPIVCMFYVYVYIVCIYHPPESALLESVASERGPASSLAWSILGPGYHMWGEGGFPISAIIGL